MRRAARQLTEPAPLLGYGHPSYAASLAEFGAPRRLRHSASWLLERRIADTDARDAMGCYPLFVCQDWRGLEGDLDELDGLVSVALVTDPFGDYDLPWLQRCFPDVAVPFKPHFVADLSRPIDRIASRHHRYYARKALGRVSVERCDSPEAYLDEWTALYDCLVSRHRLTGVKAFSRQSFALQLGVPGIVMLRATCDGTTVGAHLWYRHGDVAHSHLAAFNARGYELMASYAIYWFALETFAGEVRWLNFGAGSGLAVDAGAGLTAFKRGWATDTRMAYLCGRVLDREKYNALAAARHGPATAYFPAYRHGEFA